MAMNRKDRRRAVRREFRVRMRLKQTGSLPRLSVFKSLKHMYAQVIDDSAQKTIASYSSLELEQTAGDKKTIAHTIGLELAKRLQAHGIQAVMFDRGSFRYHGRIKALADGVREGGIKI